MERRTVRTKEGHDTLMGEFQTLYEMLGKVFWNRKPSLCYSDPSR